MAARTITLEKRLTNRYVDDYSHLDKWEDSPFKIRKLATTVFDPYAWAIRNRLPTDDFDPSDNGGGTFNFRLIGLARRPNRASSRVREDFDNRIYNLIVQNFSHHGCAHDYDCCGCGSTSINDVRWVKGQEYHVELRYGLNY